jgi:hypothetical protein
MYWTCLWTGHDDHYRFADHRVYLECQRCGRETPGWRDDDLPKPRVLYDRPVKRKFKILKPRKTA